jgi:hypothetical protein
MSFWLVVRGDSPHTTSICVLIRRACVLILLYVCPHTTIYVSSYYYMCVLILLYMCPHTTLQANTLVRTIAEKTAMLTYADVC